ncbi:hypothetical protein M2459_001406 [Parabacteroides sp. PF5-5]|uniref:DUF4249 domain-containing protein n=1 Tax=unclassified Parabacteroides TaxID=2649774 RepID=UPI0024742FC9|nr:MULTISPECIES: DUF4249 domain-containing protein [unclassified Parabacteroides]MDH6304670.1 hypothetical protein [Parabacteroides sp. PH5-39]MDH6315716.1 hypothetical protein [Parabacteroides sp. PF5-13]MDH6319376.1 hypothetical protein [Parabacteroides sp. PH5-13]MDH6323107.1 hypothetical protein [Parabacteroides sp. PH5-8]MDH6326909.1 hypothetical protein [Parabacteroides sp. PH5-41]
MKRTALQILVILLTISVTSCTSDIELDIELPPPSLVLNASLCEDSVIVAHVSRTVSNLLVGNRYSDFVDSISIDNADVELYINDVSHGAMQKAVAKGMYLMPGCYPSPGDQVRIEAKSDNYKPISASVQLQERPEITKIDTQMIYTGYSHIMQLGVSFKERRNEQNFYMLSIYGKSIIELEDSTVVGLFTVYSKHNNELVLEEMVPEYFTRYYNYSSYGSYYYPGSVYATSYIFSDELINREEYTIDLTLENIYLSYASDTLSISTSYEIELSSISESYYLYCRSKTLQYKQKEDLFGSVGLREPIPTYTNVINGYGLLSAKQISAESVELPLSETPPPYVWW